MKTLTDVRLGAWLVILARHLSRFDITDPGLSSLENILFAGKCGSLLIKLSGDSTEKLTIQRVQAHGRLCGLSSPELKTSLETLKVHGCIDWDRSSKVYEVLSLSRERVLTTTSRVFSGSTGVAACEATLPGLLDFCLKRPLLESELCELLGKTLSTSEVQDLMGLIRRFELLGAVAIPGTEQSLFYNGNQFGDKAQRIAKALNALDAKDRQTLSEIIEQVSERPGIPQDEIKTESRIRDIALGLGLIEASEVASAGGKATFLTMPKLVTPSVGEERAQLEDDVFHHAKLLLSSLRFGELRSRAARGRIADPGILVDRLLTRGTVGPCTAIGEDYVVLEGEGVIKTVRADGRPGKQFYMELRRREPAELILGLLQTGTGDAVHATALSKTLELPVSYIGPDLVRADVARRVVTRDTRTMQRFLEQLRT